MENNNIDINNAPKKTKIWQLVAFSFNNSSTNMPYVIFMAYFLYYAQSFLGLNALLVGSIITGMRVFDGVTDPIVGILIDRTDTKFGKFRPWIIVGNLIIVISVMLLFTIDPTLSYTTKLFLVIFYYSIYVLGYSMQTACTKGAGAIITTDPKQRPILALLYGSLGMIIVTLFMMYIPMSAANYELNMLDPMFWRNTALIGCVSSFIFMVITVVGLSEKDVYENYKSLTSEKVGIKDFVNIIKNNRAIQMLVIAASTDKLATTMASAVSVYFFSNIMINNGLNGMISLLSMPFMIVFVIIATFVGRKTSQKKAFLAFTWVALVASALGAILMPSGFVEQTSVDSIYLYIFFLIFLVQKGAPGVTGNFVITMISDCADYELYSTGKSVPGIMGTLFSFVDKMISSMSGLIIGLMFAAFGLANTTIEPLTPVSNYPGLHAIILTGLFIMPLLGYIASVVAMKYYPLTKETMIKVQEEITLKRSTANNQ